MREAPHDPRFPRCNLILGPASSANKPEHDASWRLTLPSLQARADRRGDVRYGSHDALRPEADILRCRDRRTNPVHADIPRQDANHRGGWMVGACRAISSTTQSMNTRSLVLTCRLGGRLRTSAWGRAANPQTTVPTRRAPMVGAPCTAVTTVRRDQRCRPPDKHCRHPPTAHDGPARADPRRRGDIRGLPVRELRYGSRLCDARAMCRECSPRIANPRHTKK